MAWVVLGEIVYRSKQTAAKHLPILPPPPSP